jgi:hypothetical protein
MQNAECRIQNKPRGDGAARNVVVVHSEFFIHHSSFAFVRSIAPAAETQRAPGFRRGAR